MSNSSVRGVHVSPGIYTKETEITYAVKSLGITTLGLVGETQRGPAFQPVSIENWRDFQSMFGGTSTEKFKDTLYPKYELPYIAKSYLSESNQLQVCRVLGLSGYNAGPAWLITLSGNTPYNNSVVAVLRSRGYYDKYYKPAGTEAKDGCGCGSGTNVQYDYQRFRVGEMSDGACTTGDTGTTTTTPRKFYPYAVSLAEYKPIDSNGTVCSDYKLTTSTAQTSGSIISTCSVNDFGRFNINIVLSERSPASISDGIPSPDVTYSVSLNPNDKDYILKVLGTTNDDGSAPIYVEALYDVALRQGIEAGQVIGICSGATFIAPYLISDFCTVEPVSSLMEKQEGSLTRGDIGRRFLANKASFNAPIYYHKLDENGKLKLYQESTGGTRTTRNTISEQDPEKPNPEPETDGGSGGSKGPENPKPAEPPTSSTSGSGSDGDNSKGDEYGYSTAKVVPGHIYVVRQFTMPNGKRRYLYTDTNEKVVALTGDTPTLTTSSGETGVVKVNDMNIYYRAIEGDVIPVTLDLNNYKSAYRFASTPWFVSNVKGDYDHIEVNRLFRFHTISDGSNANMEVKVSIENVSPSEGTFDVVVRDINDTDEMVVPLERFSRCTMVPGDSKFIGFKIGTADGEYESKSKYITVELYAPNEGVISQNAVPCGFLGYPHGLEGHPVVGQETEVKKPVLKYNCNYDEDIKSRKQYFGLSSIVGVDLDAFTFKGTAAYVEAPTYLTNGFHLDCRMVEDSYTGHNEQNPLKVLVDGEPGFTFDTVSVNARTLVYDASPIIGTDEEMLGSIFEDSKLRKFTAYFYGGFDGWDVYRKSRTNTDDYKMTKYRGQYNDYSGEGYAFDRIADPQALGLPENGITSDFYAYWAAYRQFANPETVDINIFATPGIDLFNNKLLSQEVIEMIEDERADSIYVATVPDKPAGATDYVDEMYTAEDMVYTLEDTEIDSNYTCTYFPWVKYFDQDNSQYIYLPPTKDVVRNMAQTDNTTYPWFAPAGLERGDVQCVRAHYVTRLADEDILYAGRINPVKTFAADGVKIWGQKNLQIADGQLNRIAVRRLLLRMRKLISIACLSLIFSPNDAQTKQSLQGLITPIMDTIRANRGISDYRVEITSSNATTEDRRELGARILFKPYAALEYVSLTFTVTPENVSFDAI